MLSEAMGQERDQEEEQAGGETATVWPRAPKSFLSNRGVSGSPKAGSPPALGKARPALED